MPKANSNKKNKRNMWMLAPNGSVNNNALEPWLGFNPGKSLEALAMSPALRNVRITDTLNRGTRQHLIMEHSHLGANNARAVSNTIDYKNAANVQAKLDQAVRWLKAKVGGRKYALMALAPEAWWSYRAPPRNASTVKLVYKEVKSDVWLMHKAIDGIGRWPVAFTDVSGNAMQEAYERGARVFVVLDDASYSGAYLHTFIEAFVKFLRLRPGARAVMYVAAAYASPNARITVKEIARMAPPGTVEFYAPGTMKLTSKAVKGMPWRQRKVVVTRPFNIHTTMAMVAHKVPNRVSFPSRLGLMFNTHLVPPYKKVEVHIPLLRNSYALNNHVFHRYAGGGIKVYKNVGGRLQDLIPSPQYIVPISTPTIP